MPRHLSIETVIEKNKVSSSVPFVMLCQIHITNPNTRVVEEVVYIARNDEPVIFGGNTYQPANFNVTIRSSRGEQMSVEMSAQDPTGFIANLMDEYAGGVSSKVVLMTVNAARLDEEPEIVEEFDILTSSRKDMSVSFSLGSANPLSIRFPKHRQMRDRCTWRFKGYGCGYTGAVTKCSYTLDGVDGCKAKNNERNFGGLRGLVPLNL